MEERNLSNSCSGAQAGKYLTFALGEEEYGLEILKVREIFGYMEITNVPQMPSYVKGVINLRGKVIPVINLRTKFSIDEIEISEETCIIVVDSVTDGVHVETGVIVDRVSEVLDITSENIEPSPQFGAEVETNFILGIGKVGDAVKLLLDIDTVLQDGILELSNLTNKEDTTEVVEIEAKTLCEV